MAGHKVGRAGEVGLAVEHAEVRCGGIGVDVELFIFTFDGDGGTAGQWLFEEAVDGIAGKGTRLGGGAVAVALTLRGQRQGEDVAPFAKVGAARVVAGIVFLAEEVIRQASRVQRRIRLVGVAFVATEDTEGVLEFIRAAPDGHTVVAAIGAGLAIGAMSDIVVGRKQRHGILAPRQAVEGAVHFDAVCRRQQVPHPNIEACGGFILDDGIQHAIFAPHLFGAEVELHLLVGLARYVKAGAFQVKVVATAGSVRRGVIYHGQRGSDAYPQADPAVIINLDFGAGVTGGGYGR